MIPLTPKENDTYLSAMAFIDPTHSLVQGTAAYDSISNLILGWIEEFGPNDTLEMAKKGAKHLPMWLECP